MELKLDCFYGNNCTLNLYSSDNINIFRQDVLLATKNFLKKQFCSLDLFRKCLEHFKQKKLAFVNLKCIETMHIFNIVAHW